MGNIIIPPMVAHGHQPPNLHQVIEGIAGTGAGFGRSASVLRVLKVLRVARWNQRLEVQEGCWGTNV